MPQMDKLTFGIVLTLWFASGGMSSMISTLDAIYHVRESVRGSSVGSSRSG